MRTLDPAKVPASVLEVIRELQQSGARAFLVGGCVRDLLRGQTPKDWDVASSARPEEVQQRFKRVIPTGIDHGTVTVALRGEHVEVTTFRAEAEYLDGRRPSSVEFQQDIDADLSRRDFTMNAIAWDPVGGALVDPWGGQVDLQEGVVRCVRDAFERFSEDGLRPLRAVRFATVLDFSIEPETLAAIGRTLDVFRKVAGERVQQEFLKILLSPHATRGLELLERTGLLQCFLPEARPDAFPAISRAVKDEIVRLALLLRGVERPRELVLRLKFPSKVAEETAALVLGPPVPAEGVDAPTVRRWLSKLTVERAQRQLEVAAALQTLSAEHRAGIEAVIAARPPLSTRELALDGKAIMQALGTGPSPRIGAATRFLLEQVLDQPERNTPEALRALLAGWS